MQILPFVSVWINFYTRSTFWLHVDLINNIEVNIMEEKLIINKKSLKGEDGFKTFSIRIKDETVENLDKLSEKTNRSRNELINILLDYAIKNAEVK